MKRTMRRPILVSLPCHPVQRTLETLFLLYYQTPSAHDFVNRAKSDTSYEAEQTHEKRGGRKQQYNNFFHISTGISGRIVPSEVSPRYLRRLHPSCCASSFFCPHLYTSTASSLKHHKKSHTVEQHDHSYHSHSHTHIHNTNTRRL